MSPDLLESSEAERCFSTRRPLTHSSDSSREGLAMEPTQERWLPVVGYEGKYEVSDLGLVRSLARQLTDRTGRTQNIKAKLLAFGAQQSGHLSVVLSSGGQTQSYRVHRLVLAAFAGPCPDGMEACHNDGDPTNNTMTNLRWDTHTNNVGDTISQGRHGRMGKTRCLAGHERTPENIYVSPAGSKSCRVCSVEQHASDEYKAVQRDRRDRNRESDKAQARQKYADNLEAGRQKSRDSMRAWREKHSGQDAQRARQYRVKNREQVNRRAREKRAAKREALLRGQRIDTSERPEDTA